MQEKLSLSTLHLLADGAAALAADREIGRAVNDLFERGEEDEKTRKVVLQLEMEMAGGEPCFRLKAQAKLPPLVSPDCRGRVHCKEAGGAYALFDALAAAEVRDD